MGGGNVFNDRCSQDQSIKHNGVKTTFKQQLNTNDRFIVTPLQEFLPTVWTVPLNEYGLMILIGDYFLKSRQSVNDILSINEIFITEFHQF